MDLIAQGQIVENFIEPSFEMVDTWPWVLVSDRVRIDSNMPGHILTLLERPIFKPEAEHFWPGQVIFRGTGKHALHNFHLRDKMERCVADIFQI